MDRLPPILILAGGMGTRLGGLAGGLPKSLVPVLGRPFIEHQLHLLKRQGADHLVLCVGHQEKALHDFVGDGKKFGLTVHYSSDGEKLLGTGGAVLKASALTTSPFGVLYGDSYLDVALGPIVDAFFSSSKLALMSAYRNDNRGIPSNLLVKDGLVISYDKNNPAADMQHVDFGFSIFSSEALAGFSRGTAFDLAEPVQVLIEKKQLACYETNVPFHEIGSESGIKELESYLANRSPS